MINLIGLNIYNREKEGTRANESLHGKAGTEADTEYSILVLVLVRLGKCQYNPGSTEQAFETGH